jgi:hypothetical protein
MRPTGLHAAVCLGVGYFGWHELSSGGYLEVGAHRPITDPLHSWVAGSARATMR